MHSSSGKGSKSSGKEGQCCLSFVEENKSWKNISFYHKERTGVFFSLKKKKANKLVFFVLFVFLLGSRTRGMVWQLVIAHGQRNRRFYSQGEASGGLKIMSCIAAEKTEERCG